MHMAAPRRRCHHSGTAITRTAAPGCPFPFCLPSCRRGCHGCQHTRVSAATRRVWGQRGYGSRRSALGAGIPLALAPPHTTPGGRQHGGAASSAAQGERGGGAVCLLYLKAAAKLARVASRQRIVLVRSYLTTSHPSSPTQPLSADERAAAEAARDAADKAARLAVVEELLWGSPQLRQQAAAQQPSRWNPAGALGRGRGWLGQHAAAWRRCCSSCSWPRGVCDPYCCCCCAVAEAVLLCPACAPSLSCRRAAGPAAGQGCAAPTGSGSAVCEGGDSRCHAALRPGALSHLLCFAAAVVAIAFCACSIWQLF